MPAEWEPHAATWLAWPHNHGDWPGKFEPIPWVYAEIVRNLARHERVELIVNDAAAERKARRVLERANALSENVRFCRWPTNRVWLRDSGCIFVTAEPGFARPDSRGRLSPHKTSTAGVGAPSELAAVKFRFNAWAKYSNWRYDERIGSLMATAARACEIRPQHNKTRVVLEGGSIDVNGRGTILTTEECLLSKVQQRNPGMTRKDYERVFAEYLGAPNTIWLGKGISGDDTHGHVDDITRFVAADTVVTVTEPNRGDENHRPLQENLKRLRAARDQDGKALNIVELPMPGPVIFEKRRLPASYANFYIANGVILVPVFNDPNDRIALDTLARLFPTRGIVPIYSGDFVWGLGAMHCMTQQQPASQPAKKQ
ncbi:MAG TPA: agmatine deiminase family protein [Candidatus Binatia bacterium]|nr:agmatine deiminase family protein [Candidatus Binatia bacterium]